jgi:hypothetical protein
MMLSRLVVVNGLRVNVWEDRQKKGGGETKLPSGGFREVSERLDPHRENLVIGETQFEFCMAV